MTEASSRPPLSAGPHIAPLLTTRLRFALCVMVGAYPLITALLMVLGPLLSGWPIAARTLILVPLMVSGMTFVVTPLVQRTAGGWIARGAAGPRSA